jgi:hypothetical protein
MKTTSTAAGHPAGAGTLHVRALQNTTAAEAEITHPEQALSDAIVNLAAHLGIDIDNRDSGYILIKDGDAFCDKYSASEVDAFLTGYLNGKDDRAILDAAEAAKLLLDELVMAEQIILTLMASMDDRQKQVIAASMVAAGIAGERATRGDERADAIAAARAASRGSSMRNLTC